MGVSELGAHICRAHLRNKDKTSQAEKKQKMTKPKPFNYFNILYWKGTRIRLKCEHPEMLLHHKASFFFFFSSFYCLYNFLNSKRYDLVSMVKIHLIYTPWNSLLCNQIHSSHMDPFVWKSGQILLQKKGVICLLYAFLTRSIQYSMSLCVE